MGILRDIPSFLCRRSRDLVLKIVEHPKLVVSLLEVEIMLGIDLCLWSARLKSLFYLIPAFDSKVDHTLSYWGFVPLYEFDSNHHPKLFSISDKIRQCLQNPTANQELIAAYFRVLNRMHMVKPDTFPKQTTNGIRKRFTDHWPGIRPLEKASCLTVKERDIGIVWGEVRRGQQFLRINPYLVQALEAAEEGTDIEAYLKFVTITTILLCLPDCTKNPQTF